MSIKLGNVLSSHEYIAQADSPAFDGVLAKDDKSRENMKLLRIQTMEELDADAKAIGSHYWLRVTHLGKWKDSLSDIKLTITFQQVNGYVWQALGSNPTAGPSLQVVWDTVTLVIPNIQRAFTAEISMPSKCEVPVSVYEAAGFPGPYQISAGQ
jgi:ABC-type taurine transport system substrate-binding protein